MKRKRDLDLTVGLTVPNGASSSLEGNGAWTYADVQDVLHGSVRAIMADTLRSGDVPTTVQTLWPAIRREMMEAYGRDNDRKLQLLRPGPQQLTQATEAIAWLLWIKPGRTRRVVFGRLCGISWRKLAALDGRSREYLQRVIFKSGLRQIAQVLNTRSPRQAVSSFREVLLFGSYTRR